MLNHMCLNIIENKEVLKTSVIVTQITSIKDLSLGYRAESEMFQFILENHHDPVFILKIQNDFPFGLFVDFNQFFSDQMGYTKQELFQLNPIQIFPSETVSLVQKNLKENLKLSSMIWETVIQCKDQKKIPVEMKGYAFEKEGYHLLFIFMRDISVYKNSIQELYNHKSLLERAESIGQMGYWEFDVKHNKFWASHGAREIYGIGERELSIHEIKTIPLPEYRIVLDQMIENLKIHGEKYDIEFRIHKQNDGSIINIRSMAEYDMIEKRVYGIIQDISKQKKVEQQLIFAKEKAEESDRLKSSFLTNMSHEIRTPMNGIVGFAHLLVDMEIDPETRREYNNMIFQCCNQLLGTVDDILDIAKIESGQVTLNNRWVNISNLLNDIKQHFLPKAYKKKLDFRVTIEKSYENIVLFTDHMKLNQILLNLIDNAMSFTPSGYVEYGYKLHNGKFLFFVKDTGIGIAASDHQLIFKPFCHAQNQMNHENGGTGLGLTIAESYVTMLGGQIWVESQPDQGAVFYFTIPNGEKMPNSPNINLFRNKHKTSKTCLIVEDLEMNYIFLNALLKPMKFEVLWAKNGNAAIDISLSNLEIDLVLMDIRLPGINGYQATRVIKENRPDLLIIAQSANALLDERNKALQAGCDDYITKPIDVEKFRKVIGNYFDC